MADPTAAETFAPLSYRQLSDLHRQFTAQSPELGSIDLPTFAREVNKATGIGSHVADQGLHDSWLKQASTGLDRTLEATGLPAAGGAVGSAIGSVFGDEYASAGERVGKNFPRSVANFAPLIAAEVFSGGAATPVVAGALGAGALSGAETYTETGSPAAGLVSGAAAALTPAAFGAGGQLGLKAAGAPVFDEAMAAAGKGLFESGLPAVGERFGVSAAQKAAQFVGGNLGAIAAGEVAGETNSLLQGEGLYNPLKPEHLFEAALGVVPWMALGIPAIKKSSAGEFVNDFMKTDAAVRRADATAAGARIAAGVPTSSDFELAQEPKWKDAVDTNSEEFDLVKDFRVAPKRQNATPEELIPSGVVSVNPQFITADGQLVSVLGSEKSPRGTNLLEVKPVEPGSKSFMVEAGSVRPTTTEDLSSLPSSKTEDQSQQSVMGVPPETWALKTEQLMNEWKAPEPTAPTPSASPGTNLTIRSVAPSLPSPEPLPESVSVGLLQKDVSLPEKPTTEQVREHITETISIGKTLSDKFGIDLQNLSDPQIEHALKLFSERNPNHPDPTAGFAESFRAETIRKAQEEDSLRHIGKSIGVDERTMNAAMETLSKAPKEDADTVARVTGQFADEQTLGVTEAIYRAYGTFVDGRNTEGRPYSQNELGGKLFEAGRKASMKGESKLKGKQVSLDKEAEEGPGQEEALFSQLDPGVKARMDERNAARKELEAGETVADEDVKAISDDLHLVTTLGKLSWLIKERPDMWRKIWQKNAKEGEARTRIYINLAYDKLQSGGGKITPSELNTLFAKYDKAFGTELAYYKNGEVTATMPAHLFEKLQKTFTFIDSLPEFGIEGAKGDRGYLQKMQLMNSQGTERAALVTGQEFYRRLFHEKLGYSKEQTTAYTDGMLRIIAAFKGGDRTRIGELSSQDPTQLGAYIKSFGNPLWTGIVGIAEKDFGSAKGNLLMHQIVLAHELVHGAENNYTLMRDTGAKLMSQDMFDSFKRLEELSTSLSIQDRRSFISELRSKLLGNFSDPHLEDVVDMSAASASEFRATVGALITMNHAAEGAKNSRTLRQLILEAPKEIADYMKHMARYVADMGRALWSGLRGEDAMIVALGVKDRQPLAAVAQEYYNTFSQVLNETRKIDQAVAQLQQFEQMAPDFYTTLVQKNRLEPVNPAAFTNAPDFAVQSMKKVQEEIALKTPDVIHPSFLQRNMEQFTQLAERFHVLRETSNLTFAAQHRMEQNLNRLHSLLAMDVGADGKGVFDPKMKKVTEFAQDLKSRDAFSQIARAQQDAEGLLQYKDSRVQAILKDYPDAKKQLIWNTFEKVNTQNVAVATERLTAMRETNGLIISKLIQELDPSRQVKASEHVGRAIMDGLAGNDINSIISAFQDISPEMIEKVQKLADSLDQSWKAMQQKTATMPWYFTERRYGKFIVNYKTAEGKSGSAPADTQEQADSIAAKEVNKGATITSRLTPADMRKPMSGYNDSYRAAVSAAEDRSLGTLRSILSDQPEMLARLEPLFRIEEDANAEMQANDVSRLNPFRKKSAGREYVDYFDASMISNTATVRGLTKRWLRAKAALYTLDPELVKQPALQRLAVQHVDNFLSPDAPIAQALSKANFYYYIVGNLSTMMQEPFQQLGTILPALQREGAGFFGAQKSLLNANKEMVGYWTNGKTGNAEHDQVLSRFSQEKENPHGFLSEFDSDALSAINATRFANGKSILDRAAALAKPLTHLVDLAKNAYLKVPEHNARVTMLAAFDNAKSKGMSFDAAYQEAVRIYRYSNFAGGKANRPVGVYSGRDQFSRGAAQTLLSLQTYQMGYLGMMSRLLKEGFGKGSVAGVERTQARKAAVTMLGVQFTLAGALGMPFAGQGVGLLQQLFPNLELEKHIREGVDQLVGSDSELAGFVNNSVTHGVFGEMLGADVSTRFSLGNMFGLTTSGYDPTNLLGPTGGMVRNMALGLSDASVGDLARAAQDVVPPQLKRVVDSYREGGEFRDNAGNLLFEGTPTEKTFRLLGYTPTRERDIREQQRIMARSEAASSRQLSQFYSGLADRVEQGDYAGVRDALLERQKQDYSFDARAGLRQVAKLSEQRLNPVDLRTQGNMRTADDRQKVLSTYTSQPGTSQVQRLQQRSNIERAVGIAGVGVVSPTEMRMAQMMDHLSQIYPDMTSDQVRAIATGAVAKRVGQEKVSEMTPLGR